MKKIFSILMIAVMTLSMVLTGCGQKNNDNTVATSSLPVDNSSGKMSYEAWEASFPDSPVVGKLAAPYDKLKKFTEEYTYRTTPDTVERTLNGNVYEQGWPIVKEKITLKVLAMQDASIKDINTHYLFTNLEKKTNIKIEWILAPGDSFIEKRNVLIAGGDYPDIFSGGMSKTDEMNLGSSQGVLMPLNPLMEKYGDWINKSFKYRPELVTNSTALDGNIYALPQIYYNLHVKYPIKGWINQAWLDELGLKMPTTTDEYYEVLKAFKTKDPNGNGKADEIPLVGSPKSWNADIFDFFMSAFVVNTAANGRLNAENGKLSYAPSTAEYKEALKWYKKLYDEKLFTAESFTYDGEQLKQLGDNPSAEIVGSFSGGYYGVAMNAAPSNERIKDYNILPPLKGPSGKSYIFNAPLNITNGNFAISTNCKNPEAAMRWGDWFYSPEAKFAMWYGKLGENWDYANESDKNLIGDGPAIWKYISNLGIETSQNIICGSMGLPYGDVTKDIYLGMASTGGDNYDAKMTKWVQDSYVGHEMKEIVQEMYFSNEEATEMAQINAPMEDYVKESAAKFIMGKMNIDQDWDKYISQLESIGLKRYVEIKQKAYDSYLKAAVK